MVELPLELQAELAVPHLSAAKRSVAMTGGGYWPTLIRMADGTLAALTRQGAPHVGLRSAVAVIFSRDGGATWEPPRVAAAGSDRWDNRAGGFGQMPNGDLVAVYVEARNGLGWGESGMGEFTAVQTTGWQYEPYQAPTTDRPDLGGGLLTSPASDLVTGIDSGGDRVITPVAELPTSGGQAAVIVRWALLALGVGVALLAASRRGWPVAGGGGLGRSR